MKPDDLDKEIDKVIILAKDKIDNIVFDQVDVFINKTTGLPGGIYDRRPCEMEGFVKGSTSGFYFDAAETISIRNSSVQWGENKPVYFSHVIESKNVDSLKLFNVAGESAFPDKLEAIKK